MIIFWIAAALLSAAAVALIVHFAGREPQAARMDPAAAVYRRQLDEIDELADRGLLGEEERKAAHAEAARRLLSAGEVITPEAGPNRQTRTAVIGSAVLTALVAMGIYQFIGAPGVPDQPFARRSAEWLEMAKANPGALEPEQLATVLEGVVAENPTSAEPLFFLARTQVETGQVQLGIHNLKKAAQLDPDNSQIWSMLGEALMIAAKDDAGTPEALAALSRAAELDPQNSTRARYILARAKIARGEVETGLTEWRQLAEGLPAGDPAAQAIQADIARVEKTGRLEVAAEENPQAEMIAQMVTGLAERLRQNPNDADGWARLVRSYAVLGDTEKMNAALAEARRIFKDRPSERAAIEAAVERPQ